LCKIKLSALGKACPISQSKSRVFASGLSGLDITEIEDALNFSEYRGNMALYCLGMKAASESRQFLKLKRAVNIIRSADECLFFSADIAATLKPLRRDMHAVSLLYAANSRRGYTRSIHPMCMSEEESRRTADTPVAFGSICLKAQDANGYQISATSFCSSLLFTSNNANILDLPATIGAQPNPPPLPDVTCTIEKVIIYPCWVHCLRGADLLCELRRTKMPATEHGCRTIKNNLDSGLENLKMKNYVGASNFRVECRISAKKYVDPFSLIERNQFRCFKETIAATLTLQQLREALKIPLCIKTIPIDAVLASATLIKTTIENNSLLAQSKKKRTWLIALSAYASALGIATVEVEKRVFFWPEIRKRYEDKPVPPARVLQEARTCETDFEREQRKITEILVLVKMEHIGNMWKVRGLGGRFVSGLVGATEKEPAYKVLEKYPSDWRSSVLLKPIDTV